MSAVELLAKARSAGVRLFLEDGMLAYEGDEPRRMRKVSAPVPPTSTWGFVLARIRELSAAIRGE